MVKSDYMGFITKTLHKRIYKDIEVADMIIGGAIAIMALKIAGIL